MKTPLIFILLLNYLLALTVAQVHGDRRGVRLAARAPANATRDTLDRILRTYEYNQYRFQAASCLTNANLYTDCSKVQTGANIPSLSSVYPQDLRPGGGYQYNYMYTTLTWYGFGRTNYTSIEAKMINITAQAMYYTCMSNSTCATAYNTTAGIQSSLVKMVAANSAKIKALLPADNSKTWVPSTSYASMAAYFTSFPDPSMEILGLHNSVTLALQNKTQAQVIAIYSLKQRLGGGAAMYESLMNHLALIGLDAYGNTTTYQRRDVPPIPGAAAAAATPPATVSVAGGATSFEELGAKRVALLKEIALLRGEARNRISELTMESNFKDLGVAMYSFNGVPVVGRRATCSATDRVTNWINQVNNFINNCCGATAPIRDILSFDVTNINWANGPFYKTAGNFAGFSFNHFVAVASFTDTMCNLLAKNTPCYPDPNLWSNVGSSALTLKSLLADALVLGTQTTAVGRAVGIANVACDVSDVVKAAYTNAQKCCASSGCTSPACIAGSVACTYGGAGC